MSSFSNLFISLLDSFSSSPFGYYMTGVIAIMFAFQIFHRLSRNF